MLIAQAQHDRRDRLANLALLRRSAGYSYHLANLRIFLLLGMLLVAATSARSMEALLWATPAIVGTFLHYLGLATDSYEGPNAWLRRYEAHLVRTEGHPRLNLSGIVEIWGSVALVATPAHVLSDLGADLRLLCLALAVAYMCSVAYAVYDDNSWYNPAVRSPRWQELSRMLSGPQLVLLILGLTVVGTDWPEGSYPAINLIAAYGFVVPTLIILTQFMTSRLSVLVERERQFGTGFVIEQTLRLLEPLTEARRLAEELGQPQIAALADNAIDSLRAIPEHVVHAAREDDSPPLATIVERVAILAESAGAEMSAHVPADLHLSERDRTLAALVIRDLVGNAITAQARNIGLSVVATGSRMLVVVTDDGAPMPRSAWKAPGTSSALLAARLRDRDGWLRVEQWADRTKAVTASWLMAS